MRVEYTIPGWEPGPRAMTGAAGAPAGFRQRLNRLNEGMPVRSDSLLRLDVPPVTPYSMPRPSPPEGLEVRDAATEREVWHEMMSRHKAALMQGAPAGLSEESMEQVQSMLLLLADMAGREQEVLARMQADAGSL